MPPLRGSRGGRIGRWLARCAILPINPVKLVLSG
jgi:hypothetical protein